VTEREPPRFDEPAESTLDPDGADARSLDGAPVPAPEGHLGRGAGGTVLAGPDRHLPRTVAWKVAHGARAKARLAHEARVLAALEHPAIVPIHDLVETDDGGLRIALRIVRGRTLHALVRAAPDLAARLRLVRPFLQAVEAVAWAHRLGYVHRDLKPANLMNGDLGETQVIDWGLAVIVAFDRIGDERDEARAALAARDVEIAERGVVEARRELADDQRPEAELAAARTLAVRESPEARGVLMAYARAPRPVVQWSRTLPFDCIDLAVSPDGARILCGTREMFVVLAGDRVAWSYPRPYRGARFIDGGALVLVTRPRAAPLELDAAGGTLVRELPRSGCEGAIQTDRAQVGALVLGRSCADLIDARGQASLEVCDGLHIEVAAVATPAAPGERSRVAGLCVGGDLFVVEPDGATRRAPSAVGPAGLVVTHDSSVVVLDPSSCAR